MRTGVILAGGASSRLGQDKALVDIGGKPVIARIAAALSPWVDELIIVQGTRELPLDYAAALPGARFLADSGEGPLTALIVAAKAARYGRLLVAPCDAPFLTCGTYAKLNACADATGAAAVVYERDGIADPLVACYQRDRFLAVALSVRAAHEESLQPVMARLNATRIPGDGRIDLDDIDTPAALARAMRRRPT